MDWKDIGESIAKVGLPLIGGALGGPGGAAIGQVLAGKLGADSPAELTTLLQTSPEALAAAKKFEAENERELIKLHVEALQAVNATMQAESKSERWPQYSWRPAIGFAFAAYVLSYLFLPLAGISPPAMPAEMMTAIGAILGVASWWRGKGKADGKA